MNEILVARIAFAAYSGELGAGTVHHHDGRASAGKRFIKRDHQLGGPRILCSDDDPIRLHEVVYGSALLQEFRIADDAEGMGRLAANNFANFLRRADRHRALVDDDAVARHGLGDIARHAQHMTQVCRSVLTLGCANGDEDDLRGADRLG